MLVLIGERLGVIRGCELLRGLLIFKVENNTTIGNQARPPTIQLKLETFNTGNANALKPYRTELNGAPGTL